MHLFRTTLGALAVLSTLLSGGEADAAIAFNLTIPASACQVEGYGAAALTMVDGSWEIAAGSVGMATLWCPVPHAHVDVFTGEQQIIDAFRLLYRDGDGVKDASRVTAQLFRRSPTGKAPLPVGDPLSSNTSLTTGNASVTRDLVDHTMLDQSYAFKVVLFRATPDDIAVFHGLQIFDDGV